MLSDMEPINRAILERRRASRDMPPYRAALIPEIRDLLQSYCAKVRPGAIVSNVRRVGGGASKEQFFFTLSHGGHEEHLLLRMDPRSAITETDREREFILITAMNGVVPVPQTVWVDAKGDHFPQSAAIMRVVQGVTKPSDAGVKVSGLGTWLGPRLRTTLREDFLDYLVKIHAYDWRAKPLPGFEVPDGDAKQAARWSYHYWRDTWTVDEGSTRPVMALATQWLAANLPDTAELVLTHGDYRTGNYLFDEGTGRITALLDWELARIGVFHEDLGWVLMQVFSTVDPDGTRRASDLFEREEFITEYDARSGRTVNRETLHFYDVFSSWKCNIIVAGSGLAAARSQHNHQDVLLTFLAATSPMFAADLVRLMRQGEGQ